MEPTPRRVPLGIIGRSLLLIAIVAIFARILMHEPDSSAPAQWSEQSGQTMGSTYRILFNAPPGRVRDEPIGPLMQQLTSILQEIENRVSTWNPQSELSRFNDQQTTTWVPIDIHTVKMLAIAKQLHAIDRRFDPSVAPLVDLWGFGPGGKPTAEPPPADIDECLQHVGLDKLEIQTDPPSMRKLDPLLRIDLSALAAGYAADEIVGHLLNQGVVDCYVDVAGEIVTCGNNREGKSWRIGIAEPQVGSHQVRLPFEVNFCGIATSGNYRKFIEVDDKRLGHILDPTSGSPVETDTLSATVVHPSCAYADGIATLLMTMPSDEAMRLANEHDWRVMLLVAREQQIIELPSRTWHSGP